MDVPTMLDIFESYGFETDDELTEDRKVEALNETYWEACARHEWPFLEDWLGMTIDSGGFITTSNPAHGTIRMVIKIWNDRTGRILQPIRLDDLAERDPTFSLTGEAQYYYTLGSDGMTGIAGVQGYYVWPVPTDGGANMNIVFLRTPPPLTATTIESDILFPARYHRSVLVVGTLSRLAVMQDDVELGQSYERLFEKALSQMVADQFRQQADRTDYIHMNDPDNWDYS